MEQLLAILREIDDTIEYETETALVDDKLLSSLDLTALISELEDAFGIEIDMDDIVPENFNSVDAIMALVVRLQEEA